MFGSSRRYTMPFLNRFIKILPRSSSESRETRFYDRGARNVALGRRLLKLVARSRSNWLEGRVVDSGGLEAWTEGG